MLSGAQVESSMHFRVCETHLVQTLEADTSCILSSASLTLGTCWCGVDCARHRQQGEEIMKLWLIEAA